MTTRDTTRTIEAVWRIESGRLIAGLTRIVGDVGFAEDLAQDALVAALEKWPGTGVPPNPGGWLMTTAKNRGIDTFRRQANLDLKQQEIARALQHAPDGTDDIAAVVDEHVEDDLLRLMFLTCHPALPQQARTALTLKAVAGLSTSEIARAFLVPESTVAQRIVRAKKTLQDKGITFKMPDSTERTERLDSVLGVVYLLFNEGYSATEGEQWLRRELCEEALRLGRILAGLVPAEPEVHGLVALMEIQASRSAARVDAQGRPVLLLEQDRARWDQLLVRRGLAALDRARALGGEGPYALQAAIAACHARARQAADTDWAQIAALYGILAQRHPSPVVELNRAVAVSMAEGPAAALGIVDGLLGEKALKGYHLLPAVRGDLLEKLGRGEEARAEFERAAGLTRNEAERGLLLARVSKLVSEPDPA